MMWRKKFLLGLVCFTIFCVTLSAAEAEDIIFSEDFELCIPFDWSIDNGLWECCIHSEPQPWGGGSLYATTICDGNYLTYTDSRLISPEIQLPDIIDDEELHLRFWHWFSYTTNDRAYVQIRVYNDEWSNWTDIGRSISQESAVWSPMDIDLTAYAGQLVQIAFYHTADNPYNSSGWRIDDIRLIQKTADFSGDFECGWEDWSADRGIWEVGSSAASPVCYSGEQCAGTVLSGNYPTYTDSRLVSPSIVIPSIGECEVCFYHWLSYTTNEAAYIQIQGYDDIAGVWSTWETIGGPFRGVSIPWFPTCLDLTAYFGQKIRIAFYHTADNPYNSSGWYIDHIRINCDTAPLFPHFCECDLNQDGSCNILDWPYFIEDWGRDDCGTPPGSGNLPNDCECDFSKDGSCNILDWPRFIEDWGKTDCLTCDGLSMP
jgi:hypothetical protein